MYSLHLSGLVVRRGKIYFFAQDLSSIMNTHTHTHIQRIDLDRSTFLDMNTGTKYDCLPAHSPQQWLGCPYHVANLILGLQGRCLLSLRFASSVVGNQHQSPMGWGQLTWSDQRRLSGAGVQMTLEEEKEPANREGVFWAADY